MNDLHHLAIATKNLSFYKILNAKENEDFLLENVCTYAVKNNIKMLSLYSVSSEKFSFESLERYKKFFIDNKIRFILHCDEKKIQKDLYVKLKEIENKTKINEKLELIFCMDYNAKKSLLATINKLSKDEISQENIDLKLDNEKLPQIDLLIRTEDTKTLSGIPLWQCAYAEFGFTKSSWEEFTCKELDEMIGIYTKTHRRFGGL